MRELKQFEIYDWAQQCNINVTGWKIGGNIEYINLMTPQLQDGKMGGR